MKKTFLMISAAALVALTGCKQKQAETTEVQDVAEAPVETSAEAAQTPTVKPFIATAMETDSTIVVLPSGMAYKVVKQGEGAKPSLTSTVKVNYTGKHIDGTVFDSSNGNPIDFPLTGVIKGFSEGISQMPVGSSYILYIPSEMGYGERGAGDVIAPGEDLIFEVELISFTD